MMPQLFLVNRKLKLFPTAFLHSIHNDADYIQACLLRGSTLHLITGSSHTVEEAHSKFTKGLDTQSCIIFQTISRIGVLVTSVEKICCEEEKIHSSC